MTIYITGGAGFIGSNLIEYLNFKGHTDIYIVDHLRSNNKWKNLVGLQFNDIISPKQFERYIIDKEDVVVHLGACSNTREFDADYLWENNTKYSRSLIDDATLKKARVIYASSASVYGNGKHGYDDLETMNHIQLLKPLNPYAFSKQKIDEYVIRHQLNKQCVGLRFFNVWGPRESHKAEGESLPSKARRLVLEGKTPTLYQYKDIPMERDFIYVRDVCVIIYKLIENRNICGIYNVGTGTATSWDNLLKALLVAICKPDVKIDYKPLPEEMVPNYQFSTKANVNKLQLALDTFNITPLHVCMDKFIKYEQ